MNNASEYVFNKLLLIQKKHRKHFAGTRHIFSCVHINWEVPVSVRVICTDLPIEVRSEIEETFPTAE